MADPSEASGIRAFLAELRRRHVYQVAVVYAAVAFVIWQVCAIAFPALDLPDWTVTLVVALTIAGFPVAVVLAWAYERTPDGIVRDDREPYPAGPSTKDGSTAETQTLEGRKSIVVLPFDNMSPDPNDAYFSDGLTEEIITQLSYLKSLRVISRNSAMVLKDTKKSTRQIGHELNVGYVMEGSVRRSGADLRITAQLIDVDTDAHLWAETYARKMRDVFEVQSEIAFKVAEAMRASLDPHGVERINARPTDDLDAHDAYLLGRHHFWRMTEAEVFWKARGYFEQALEIDPGYSAAQAGLAWWYLWAGPNFGLLPASDAVPRARAEARRAIDLDPDSGDAHGALALVEAWYYWEWQKAEELGRLGVERDPNSYNAWFAYENVLGAVGRFEECLSAIKQLFDLDPFNWVTPVQAAFHHCNAGRLDDALSYARRCDEIHAGFWGASIVAYVHQARGEHDAALARLIAAEEHWETMRSSIGSGFLAYALGRAGRLTEFDELAEFMERRVAEGTGTWSELAYAYMRVDDLDRALDCLEKAPDEHPPGNHVTAYVGVMPVFDPIRQHPRFQAVLKRLGLPTRSRIETTPA